jgi:hypothetical protein
MVDYIMLRKNAVFRYSQFTQNYVIFMVDYIMLRKNAVFRYSQFTQNYVKSLKAVLRTQ